RILSGTAM
ncbi:unnamed protein product, partial [Leptidea sinapis]